MSDPVDDALHLAKGEAPPAGWYPDPSGAPAWRRWEGATWGEATMSYGPATPDPTAVASERASWSFCRAVAPWALAGQAVWVLLLASQSPTFGILRTWVRAYLVADEHHRPLPTMPANALGAMSSTATIALDALFFLTIVGIVAWLRFSVSSMRVAASSRYPQHHHAVATSLLFFIPIAGPIVAWWASRASLPSGHEGRSALAVGWVAVACGQAAFFAVNVTVLWSSSATAAWVVASVAAALWVAAAVELPGGLRAIAEDHASLGVRRGPSYS